MIVEVDHAVQFILQCHQWQPVYAIAKTDLTYESWLGYLQECLTELIVQHYVHHWHPSFPEKGSAYRALLFEPGRNERMLPEQPHLKQALLYCGLSEDAMRITFAQRICRIRVQWMLWIDPGLVTYRCGDYGNVCTVYEDEEQIRLREEMEYYEQMEQANRYNMEQEYVEGYGSPYVDQSHVLTQMAYMQQMAMQAVVETTDYVDSPMLENRTIYVPSKFFNASDILPPSRVLTTTPVSISTREPEAEMLAQDRFQLSREEGPIRAH